MEDLGRPQESRSDLSLDTMTKQEEYLRQMSISLREQRGMGGSQILAGSGASASIPAGKRIVAIEPIGTTRTLGTVTGDCAGLSGFTFSVKTTVYGNFSAVTVGAAATDVFIVYFSA